MPENPASNKPSEFWVKERGGTQVFSVGTIGEFIELCNDGHMPAIPEEVESFMAIQAIKRQVVTPENSYHAQNREIFPEVGLLYLNIDMDPRDIKE